MTFNKEDIEIEFYTTIINRKCIFLFPCLKEYIIFIGHDDFITGNTNYGYYCMELMKHYNY
jgi:hypothetical protein